MVLKATGADLQRAHRQHSLSSRGPLVSALTLHAPAFA